MASEASWYLLPVDGEQLGPYTEEELRAYAAEGRIAAEDQLWAEGLEEWVEAAQVEGLFPAPQALAPTLVTGAVQSAPPAGGTSPVASNVGSSPGIHFTTSYPTGAPPGMHPAGATFDPVFVKPLRTVCLGLSFLLWGTWCVVIGVVLVVSGVAWASFGSESVVSDMLMIVGGFLIIAGYALRITGASISINVPSAAGARGFIIASLCCEAVGLLALVLPPVGWVFDMAGLILLALFLRKLALFTNVILYAIEAKSLIIHASILTGLGILAPVIILLVFGGGLLVGAATGSGEAGLGAGAILTLVLLFAVLFFVISVLVKSIHLLVGLRDAIRRRCLATVADQGSL